MRRFLVAISLSLSVSCVARAVDAVPLGVVDKDQTIALKMRFTAPDASDVVVAKAATSCDCLQSWFNATPVAHGATADLSFTYLSHRAGRVAVEVDLLSPSGAVLQHAVVRGFVADPSLLVSPAQLRGLCEHGAAEIVDLRPAGQFAAARLPRSLNVLPFAVKARQDLRAKKLVLIDDGALPDALMEQVMALRELGFKDVSGLQGGLPAWIRAGYPVDGANRSGAVAATILASQFSTASATADWQIIEIAGGPTPLAGAIEVADWQGASAAIAAVPAARAGQYRPAVLVVAGSDSAYAHIEHHLGGATVPAVFYLSGGRMALESLWVTQAALAISAHQLVRVQSPTRSHGAVSGGCKSCGK